MKMTAPGVVVFSRGETNSDFDDIWDDTALIAAYDKAVNSAKEILKQRKDTSTCSGSLSESSCNVEIPQQNLNRRRRRGNSREKNSKSKWPLSWKSGDHCRAMYTADGQLYEAEIQSVNTRSDTCTVQFVGYGNCEEVFLQHLQTSHGEQARESQIKEAELSVSRDNHVSSDKRPKGKHSWKQKHPKGGHGDSSQRTLSNKADKRRSLSGNSSHVPFISGYVPGAHDQMPHFSQPWANLPFSNIPPMHLPPPPLPFAEDAGEDDEALSSMLMAWYMSGYHTGFYQGLKTAKNKQVSACSSTYSSNHAPSCSHNCSNQTND